MVDVTIEDLSFLNQEKQNNAKSEDGHALEISDDGEDTATSLFNSFMEIAETEEMQNAIYSSSDFEVVPNDNKYVADNNDNAVLSTDLADGTGGHNLIVTESCENVKTLLNNSASSKENCSTYENFKAEEATCTTEQPAVVSDHLNTVCSSVETKKKSNISYRLSKTLDNLDILEQQLFTFMQTQNEHCTVSKDCPKNKELIDTNSQLEVTCKDFSSLITVNVKNQLSSGISLDDKLKVLEIKKQREASCQQESDCIEQRGLELKNIVKLEENHGYCKKSLLQDNICKECKEENPNEKYILVKTKENEQNSFDSDCENKSSEICNIVMESASEKTELMAEDVLSSKANFEDVGKQYVGSNLCDTEAEKIPFYHEKTLLTKITSSLPKETAGATCDRTLTELETPDIEVELVNEIGIIKQKSVDSSDISQGSCSGSPVLTDEANDSDSHSDLAEEESVDKRKSWHLEASHFMERSNSESSTVSEREYQLSLHKGERNGAGTLSEGDFIRGHLLKLGGSGFTPRNWRKRWCLLRKDNCLYYYKTSKEKIPSGVVVLSNYSVSKAIEVNKKFCFKLSKGGARTYYFCAADENGMRKWMIALMDAAQRSSEKGAKLQISEGSVHNVSIPALSIQDPDCHGYLLKHGLSFLSWRRRYCVLKNGYLYYYSDMANTMALGVARLIGYTIEMGEHHGSRYCFRAIPSTTHERVYLFAADTETDRKRWVSRLEASIKKGSDL